MQSAYDKQLDGYGSHSGSRLAVLILKFEVDFGERQDVDHS